LLVAGLEDLEHPEVMKAEAVALEDIGQALFQ
jgi:hypothetical protein